MNKFQLQQRTKNFHIAVIHCCSFFPSNAAGYETAKQLIRSAGSVGANYRAACRAKSTKDFIYKLEVVLEEADESLYWLEISRDAALLRQDMQDMLKQLIQEAVEIVKIFNAADRTAKKNYYEITANNKYKQ